MIPGRTLYFKWATDLCRESKTEEILVQELMETQEYHLLQALRNLPKDKGLKINVGITVEHPE